MFKLFEDEQTNTFPKFLQPWSTHFGPFLFIVNLTVMKRRLVSCDNGFQERSSHEGRLSKYLFGRGTLHRTFT